MSFILFSKWYFGLGGAVAIAFVLAMFGAALKDDRTRIPVAIACVLVSIIGWPLIVYLIIQRIFFNPHRCGWCMKEFRNRDLLKQHIGRCDASPYVRREKIVYEIIADLRGELDVQQALDAAGDNAPGITERDRITSLLTGIRSAVTNLEDVFKSPAT